MCVKTLSSPVPVVTAGCTHQPGDSAAALSSRGIGVLSCWCCPWKQWLGRSARGGTGATLFPGLRAQRWGTGHCQLLEPTLGPAVRNGLPVPGCVKSHFLIYCFLLTTTDWFSHWQDFFHSFYLYMNKDKIQMERYLMCLGTRYLLLFSGVCKLQPGLMVSNSGLHFPHLFLAI